MKKNWMGSCHLSDLDRYILREFKCIITLLYIEDNVCRLHLLTKDNIKFECTSVNLGLCCMKAYHFLVCRRIIEMQRQLTEMSCSSNKQMQKKAAKLFLEMQELRNEWHG